MNPDGSQEKFRVEMEDLRIAAAYAEQDLKDRWQQYRNKYLRKLKK